MLGFMRKHARSSFIKVAFWMIIIVFVFWGVGVMVGGSQMNVAAKVDGAPITAQEYQRAYENMQRIYQQLYRENFTPQVAAQLNLHQRALDDLIIDLLLKREAARLGLQVSDDEVRDAILNMPNFRNTNRFDRSRYLATLRASRVSPTEFEESQRQQLLVGKLESLVTDGITVSERELHDLFVLENEKINVAFVKLPYKKYRDNATVAEGEIAEYYEQNRESFREPERVRFTFVAYSPEAFQAAVPVTDASIATYYETHESDYESPEKVRVREILFPAAAGADDAGRAEVRTKAEAVLAEAKAGGDFAALARTHSGDTATASAGGDLGLLERGTLEAPLEEAISALEPGQVSDLVETSQGFAIVKLDERQAHAVRPLTEVREEIVRVLRESGADQTARDALLADLTRAREGAAIEELASARGLTATTSPPVARGEQVPGVKGTALPLAALGLEAGAVDQIAEIEPPYYLLKVVEKIPSTIQPLDQARETIRGTLLRRKASEAARADAEALRAAAAATGGLAGLTGAARDKGYTVEETGPFGRNQPAGALGPLPKSELFALSADAALAKRVYDLPDAAVVVALKERVPPDETLLAEKRDGLRDGAVARKRTEAVAAYRDMLRQRANIRVNPNIVTGARI